MAADGEAVGHGLAFSGDLAAAADGSAVGDDMALALGRNSLPPAEIEMAAVALLAPTLPGPAAPARRRGSASSFAAWSR